MGVAIATGGAMFARPWWKAAIVVVLGSGFAAWGYWRAPSEQERRRAR